MEKREIKFRAWDQSHADWNKKYAKPNGKNEPLLEMYNWEDFREYGMDVFYEPSQFQIMQYTGIKDKNGKDAYVGNIYKCEMMDGSIRLYKIFTVKGGFAINTHQDDFYKDPSKIAFYSGLSDMQTASFFEGNLEEIGNIYENPELLTTK